MNLKQSLHSLLADNETAEVIKQLRSITEGTLTALNEEVEQISTRFQNNIEQSHHELADEATTNRENSSIRYALFSVIDRLPEDAILPAAQQAKRLKIAAAMVAGVVLFALIAFNYTDFLKKDEPKTSLKPIAIEPTTTISTPAVAPVTSLEAPAAPAAAPVTTAQTPQIVVDSVPKVDTLRKKKVRRIKKVMPVIGDTFKVN